jgi:hypothetical protein
MSKTRLNARNFKSLALAATASLAALAIPSAAQDVGADPTFGDVSLDSGFTPDPYNVNIVSGGNIPASSVRSSCAGYIANAPDFDLYYSAGSLPLYIWFEASEDTTLVINAPDGSWICDDDNGPGTDPMIYFSRPQSGLYDIWVGSYDEDERARGTLHISEIHNPNN